MAGFGCDVYLCGATTYRDFDPGGKGERNAPAVEMHNALCQEHGGYTYVKDALEPKDEVIDPSSMLLWDDCVAQLLEKWTTMAKCSDRSPRSSPESNSSSSSSSYTGIVSPSSNLLGLQRDASTA